MRINAASKLTADDVHLAISFARYQHKQDIWLDADRGVTVGPRGAIEFYCHSHFGKVASGRHDNPEGYRSASWTAWGYVIAELFTRDPNAHIGRYRGRDHFIRTIYGEQRRYILRQSLGIRAGSGIGSDCSFLSLFSDNEVSDRCPCGLPFDRCAGMACLDG